MWYDISATYENTPLTPPIIEPTHKEEAQFTTHTGSVIG